MGGRPRIDGIEGVATLALAGVVTPSTAPADGEPDSSTLRAGSVGRGLRAGMSPAEVVVCLGEPGIVTRGRAGREIWVWDGVPGETLDVRDRTLDVRDRAPAPGLLAGAGIAKARAESVVTVVVRFDEMGQVSSVSLLACRG